MTHSELSEHLCRPALWISRMRKHFGMQILEDSRYRRLAVLLLARSRSLQLRSHALLSIRSSESWRTECHWCFSTPLIFKRKRLVGTWLSHSSRTRSPRSFGSEDAWSGTNGRQMGDDALRLLREYRELLDETLKTVSRESKVLKGSLRWAKSVGFPPRHV